MDVFDSFAFWVDMEMTAWDDGQLADFFPVNFTEFTLRVFPTWQTKSLWDDFEVGIRYLLWNL